MVATTLRRHARHTLARMPYVWESLRHYIRYSPRGLVPTTINQRVHDFYVGTIHSFVTRTSAGHYIEGDTRDIIQRYLFLYGCWEPNLSRWLTTRLQTDDVFVDVGANIGHFSLLAAARVGPSGSVVSIEASPSIYERLNATIRLNGVTNIRPVHAAVADARGHVRLFRAPAANLGASSIYADVGYEDEGEVDAYPLYQLLTAEEVRRARVIKIDVEGAEATVVKGLLPLLPTTRADLEIIIEVGGGPKGSPAATESASAIIAALAEHGFQAYRIVNDYQPSAYISARPYARPLRVQSASDISEECDLIFSRCDAPSL